MLIKEQTFDDAERQEKIFQLKYIQMKSIGYIADTLFISTRQVTRDLKDIRNKVKKML